MIFQSNIHSKQENKVYGKHTRHHGYLEKINQQKNKIILAYKTGTDVTEHNCKTENDLLVID